MNNRRKGRRKRIAKHGGVQARQGGEAAGVS